MRSSWRITQMATAGRVKNSLLRLGDFSLVAMAVSCGYVGYNRNASEDAAAKQQRILHEQSLTHRRRVEKAFFHLAKQYDLKVDELIKKRDQVYKIGEETETISAKVLQHSMEVGRDIEKLEKALKDRDELQQQASSLRQQRRTLNAEVQELSKLVKIKEDLEAKSKSTCSPASTDSDELQVISSKVKERNRMLEAEIEELMRLVKTKEELQAKAEALDEHIITHHLGDPMLKKDDSVQT